MTVRFPTGKREAKKGADMDSAVPYLLTHFETPLWQSPGGEGICKEVQTPLAFGDSPNSVCVLKSPPCQSCTYTYL